MSSNAISKTILILFVIFSVTHCNKKKFHNVVKHFKHDISDPMNHRTNNFATYLINHAKSRFKSRGMPIKRSKYEYDTRTDSTNNDYLRKNIDFILKIIANKQGSHSLKTNTKNNLNSQKVIGCLKKIDKQMKDVNLEYVTEEWNNILNEIDRFASPRVEQLYKKIISAFQVYNWIYRSVAGFDTTLPIMDSSRSYDDGQNIALLLINAYEKTAELYSTTSADKLTSIPGQTRFIIITDRNRGRALSLLRKALGKIAQN